ncbi:MAG: transglycosylase domain-containing protein, partial [Micropruina sp.]
MADSAPKRSAEPTKARGRLRGFLKWAAIGLLSVMLLGGVVAGVGYATVQLPDPNAEFQTNTSFVYYADGRERLGSFQVQNRVTLDFEDIPQNVKDAIVAGENRSFWTDPGISFPGLLRAVGSVITRDDVVGGSTITQQYIKVLYLSQEKTATRKIKEILLAAKMGNEMTKEEILAGYLNTVYFGRGAYGIEAAAQTYFGKGAKKLTDAEAIALTAIVNSPGNLDPAAGDKQAADLLERYQYTINGLVEMGKFTEAQKAELYAALPTFPKMKTDSRLGGPKGFLLKMVQDELKAKGFTEDEINGGGLKVISTFDGKAQDAAVAAAQKVTRQASGGSAKKAKDLHAAIASVSVATGEVIALYGGPDYVDSSRNWATTARPVGSTFKAYALLAGLRDGFTLNDTFNGNSFTPKGDARPVTNAGGGNYGTVTLLKATTSSINSAYVDLVSQIPSGGTKVLEAARDAGLPEAAGWIPNDRVPLGTPEVSPLNQASGFATFANEGTHQTPHVVKEVKDSTGATIYKASLESTSDVDPDDATDVTYALSKVAEDGTGRRAAALGYPVAGKTGTYFSQDAQGRSKTMASWFVGYTKQISTAVMFVAGDEGTSDLDNYTAGFYGSGYPSLTWLEYMRVAQNGLPSEEFDGPTNRVSTQKPTLAPPTTASAPPRTSAAPT